MAKGDNSIRAAKHKHIASYAIYGPHTGNRVGTHFVHKPEQIESVLKMKHFRWSSSQARRDWLAWFKRHKGE